MEQAHTFTNQVALIVEEMKMATPEFIISPDYINISKKFLESFYYTKNEEHMMIYRQKVADSILCKKGIAKTFGKALRVLIEEVKRQANPITYNTLRVSAYKSAVFLQAALLNYSECSAKLARNLMKDKNYIQSNKLILHGVCVADANLPVNQSILHFLKCTLTCTHNLLKFCGDEARVILKEKGFKHEVLKYKDSSRTDIKNLSLFILAYLAKDELELKLLEKTTVDLIMTSLKDAFENKIRKADGFRPVELCACLEQIVKLEPIQSHLMTQNILLILRRIYRSGSRRTACIALLTVWTLAFNPTFKAEVKRAFGNFIKWELNNIQRNRIPTEQKHSDNKGKDVLDCTVIRRWSLSRRPSVSGTSEKTITENTTFPSDESLFMQYLLERITMELNFEEKLLERMTLQTNNYNTNPHVMISYNPFYRNLATQLANRLKAAGFKVWLDVEQSIPAGNPLENILTAIEQSFVVCAIFSELYELSQSTRAEAKYASRLGKPFVFFRAQKNYSPNGWLKDMMKTAEAITFEFSSKHISDPTFEDVRRKMEGHRAEFLRKMKDDCTSRSIVMLYSAPTESKEGCNDSLSLDEQILRGDMGISSWNATKVKEWMNDHKINWENTENLNGQDLCFLKRLRNEAPEFFYKMASEKWRITSVSALRKLTNSLESL